MMKGRKLLHHDKVEVRQLEDGLGGSWHSGVIVGVSDSCRKVKYDELLCESGHGKLIESIPVTGAIEGLYLRPSIKSTYRGRIRPRPPVQLTDDVKSRLQFGLCVDAWYKEAWWEGVTFDHNDGANERCVYFPDEGDERSFKISDLRITLEWDEFSGNWRERGTWTLVSLAQDYKKEGHLYQLITRVWSRLKVHYGFLKMISEWTCGAYCVWKEYFSEVVCELTSKSRPKGVGFSNTSRVRAVRRRRRRARNVSVLTRSMHQRKEKELSLAVRTRRMCLSEPENSPNCAGPKGGALTEISEVDEETESDHAPNLCSGLKNGSGLLWEGCHNDLNPTTSSCTHEHNLEMFHSRGNLRRYQNKLILRNSKQSKGDHYKLGVHASDGSRVIEVNDGVLLRSQGHQAVGKQDELMRRRMKKGGLSLRSIPRKQKRIRRKPRTIRKKRMPMKMTERETRMASQKSKPILKDSGASIVSVKDNDTLDIHWHRSSPDAASCHESRLQDITSDPTQQRSRRSRCIDSVCFVCQYGGELLHCEQCVSSYHLNCIDLKEVAVGESFCPSCTCGLCGLKSSAHDTQLFTEVCYQCSRQYHIDCLDNAGISISEESYSDKFCSKNCYEICVRLHELMQVSNPTSSEGLSWTITRSRRNDCNVHSERVHPLIQVSQVLKVLHECFEPIIEPHTERDLVADIVYNSGSKFKRLDFHGFYVMGLVEGEELVCVATIRIHGQKVAEMPLVATPFKYRRKGMCRLLVDELEKMLVAMGVERLVLPGIAQLSDTWVSSFGFTEMPDSVRKELLGYPFVLFQGTTLFQKVLRRPVLADSLQLLEKPEEDVPRSIQENNGQDDINNRCTQQENNGQDGINRRYTLQYKRRQKPNNTCNLQCKRRPKSDNPGKDNQSAFKLVYKRRRIQASRDSLDSR